MNLKNRLPSTIVEIKKGKLNAQINLDWLGVPLSVIITTTSAEEMELCKGDPVDVLFKASDVILAKNLTGKLSARNVFDGKITGIIKGFPLSMVTIEAKGATVKSEITAGSLDAMALNEGDEIQVVIKYSELILAKGLA